MTNEELHDIWRAWGFSDTDDPNEITRKVNLNVGTLVREHVMREHERSGEGSVYLVLAGRKSSHLIQHEKPYLEEQGFIICLHRMFHSRFAEWRPEIPRNSRAILLADAIHTGSETRDVLAAANKKKIAFEKIFCYILNAEGLKDLASRGIVREEQVTALFPSRSEEEYEKESRQLQAFFRSRIEPMDPDICYDKYNVNIILKTKEATRVLNPMFQSIFSKRVTAKVSDDRGLASNIAEVSYSIDKCPMFDELTKKIFQPHVKVEVESLCLRIKMNQKTVDSDFTAIVTPQVTYVIEDDEHVNKCVKDANKCMLSHYSYKKKDIGAIKKILCPNCLNICFSHEVLQTLQPLILEAFQKERFEPKLIWRYRPLRVYTE